MQANALEKNDPKNSAVVWLVLMVGQIIVTIFLLMLSALHFGLVQSDSDLCGLYNATDESNNNTSATGGPSCGFSIAVLVLAFLACIVSIVDTSMNFRYIMQRVFGNNGNDAAPQSQEQDDKRLSCFPTTWAFPINVLRVWYCWILVNTILVTIAANTYEWSWETNDLEVLINTMMFFLTSIVYLLLIVAMVMWHGCCYGNCCRSWIEKEAGLPKTNLTQSCEKRLVPLLTIGLIISNTFCVLATLITFFYPIAGYSNRTAGFVMVLVHVIVSSTCWCVQLIYDTTGCCSKWFVNMRMKRCGTNIVVCSVIVIPCFSIIVFIPVVIIIVVTKPHNNDWLLMFLIPLLVWIFGIIIAILRSSDNQSSENEEETLDKEELAEESIQLINYNITVSRKTIKL